MASKFFCVQILGVINCICSRITSNSPLSDHRRISKSCLFYLFKVPSTSHELHQYQSDQVTIICYMNHLQWPPVLVSQGLHFLKCHKLVGLNNENLFSHVMEAKSQKSRCHQDHIPSEGSRRRSRLSPAPNFWWLLTILWHSLNCGNITPIPVHNVTWPSPHVLPS